MCVLCEREHAYENAYFCIHDCVHACAFVCVCVCDACMSVCIYLVEFINTIGDIFRCTANVPRSSLSCIGFD